MGDKRKATPEDKRRAEEQRRNRHPDGDIGMDGRRHSVDSRGDTYTDGVPDWARHEEMRQFWNDTHPKDQR